MTDLRWRCGWLAAAWCSLAATAAAQHSPRSLAELSFEELGNIEITSPSRRAERLADAPAAAYVITGDEIRRSGATVLAEALRLAPNLHVARTHANGWSISARGFNSSSANKLLVLVDGRSVYSPLFSGVFWDVQDLLLEDIERIEVVSGPGGTLWGVNAVNGVVNVITRTAAQSQGGYASAGAGNFEAELALRHGGRLGEHGHYRVHAKHLHRRHTETAAGTPLDDASHTTQLGFRTDWARAVDKLSVQGQVYQGRRDQPLPGTIAVAGVNLALDTIDVSGAHLMARWDRELGRGGSLSAQALWDRTERTVPPTFAETLDVVDLQLQHAWRPWAAHHLVWGGQLRQADDRVANSVYVAFLPAGQKQAWTALFAQDEVELRPDLKLTLGARLERNDYTGTEFLPNLRLAWKPSANRLLWAALSRTVRAPSRLDRDTFVPGEPPFVLGGGPDFQSETARVLELGLRDQPSSRLTYSATVFHGAYDRLHTLELTGRPSPAVVFGNGMRGSVAGMSAWGTFQPRPWWRLRAGALKLWQDLELRPGSRDAGNSVATTEGASPTLQWMLRSSMDLPREQELDATLRHVSALSAPHVPAYTALDLSWAWRPHARLEYSVAAQNLLGPGHGEFTDVATRARFDRTMFVKLATRF